MSKSKSGLYGAAAIWAIAGAAAASAQTVSADPASSQAAASPSRAADAPTGAGEIVVTATRREQALQSVPIAVSAVSADMIAKAHITSTADLSRTVSNINITSQVGATVVYLRGVGQLATNPGQEPSVATYIDGVYQPTVFGSLTSLSNVSRVEVIKGPQGTLFGRNATGGLVNVVTKDPSYDSHGELSLSYGNYQTMRATGYYTAGLGAKAAMDFAFNVNDQNRGVGHNEATGARLRGTQNIDLRSKLLLEPSDRTKIRISGSFSDNKSPDGNDLAVLPGSTPSDGSSAPRNFYDINANYEPHHRNQTYQIAVRIDQEFEPFDLVSISAYTHTRDIEYEDADATPTPKINAILSQKGKFFTQEVQLVSKKGSPLTWIVGAFYYHADGRGTPTGTGLYGDQFGGGGINSRGNQKTDSYSVYGEGTYEILPKLNITLGGRYTIDRKTLTGETVVFDPAGNVVADTPVDKARKTFKDPTYRAILDYHFTPAIMGYVSYSRGFKSGGYDTGFPTGMAFKPETVDAFEGGFKTQLLDRKLTLNIAGFHYNYKNLQLPILVNVDGVPSQITVNAATAKVYGVDIDGGLRLSRNFTTNFGFGFLHSKYDKFLNAPCTEPTSDPATSTVQFACEVSGRNTTHAPKITYNLGGTYTVPTSFGDISLSGNWSYQSRFYYTPDNRLSQKGYGLLGAQLAWTSSNGGVTVTAFADNLTDKKYTTAQYAQAMLGDSYVAGSPRMYGLEGRFKF